MLVSRKRKRWMSIFVGVVGLVTIIGLSDLVFIMPQQAPVSGQSADSAPVSPAAVAASSSERAPSSASSSLPSDTVFDLSSSSSPFSR